MPDAVDVLVVGAGPAGLAAAAAAAPSGSVLVVHRDERIGRPVRTSGGSWLRDMERLGLPPTLYHPIRGLALAGPNRRVTVEFGADLPVVLDVTRTYEHLAKLAEHAGARVACGSSFEGLAGSAQDWLDCSVRGPAGSRIIRAQFVVEASGSSRSVLAALGKGGRPARFGVGAENEYEDLSDRGDSAALFVGRRFAPSGYGWVFPTGKSVRIGIGLIHPDTAQNPARLLDEFMKSDSPRALGVKTGRLLERRSGVIPADGPAQEFVHGRVVAVGDAAGQALPLVGEGISYCIEAGRMAGAAVGHALQQAGSWSEHLASYQSWWDARLRRRFALAQRLNQELGRFSDEDWDRSLARLSLMDGDQMAAFLRLELWSGPLLRLALRHPWAFLDTILKR